MGASFIGSGLMDLKMANVLTIRCSQVSDIAERLRQQDVRNFLARHVPIAETEVQ
jgi:hypothetical protein